MFVVAFHRHPVWAQPDGPTQERQLLVIAMVPPRDLDLQLIFLSHLIA